MPEPIADQEIPVEELPRIRKPFPNAIHQRFADPYLSLSPKQDTHNLLAFAVHEVLLDMGFVLFDPVSGLETDRFYLPFQWYSPVSFSYSLPKLLCVEDDSGPNLTDYVVLKFQTLGRFLQVFGSLVKGDLGLHRLSLDEDRYWVLLTEHRSKNVYKNGFYNSYLEKGVSNFWKIVKDELVLPLLIDLSYATGLSLPACLISLPFSLKLSILEFLPGVDIARMACVCSEMRNAASIDDLWKRKVEEEFGDGLRVRRNPNWKRMFRKTWRRSRKKRKRLSTVPELFPRVYRPLYFRPVR
ncbi:hypothetical protein V6N13_102717 [Hibiscus sabdariffa]|uniref:F-box domain-containing protein n=1 Tax=Hibiscus sabdariffa TaxID=183260 RepID=A0ABR2D4X4_9ROSI